MTETLPSIELALVLGMRHGLVPDYLAVDGARFALGLGCVMLAIMTVAAYGMTMYLARAGKKLSI